MAKYNSTTKPIKSNGNIKPLNTLSLCILDSRTNNRDSARKIDNSELFTIVDVISKMGYLIVKLHCESDILKDNIDFNSKERHISINFFDTFGYGDEYMYVFDDIKRATTLSNSEIATIVQDELSCEFEDIYLNESYFEFKLEKSKIG